MKEKKERNKELRRTRRQIDNKGVDFYRQHGMSRANDGLAVHRMIGSFPIVAHNQQYNPGHSGFQICRHDLHREPFIYLYTGRYARAYSWTHTYVRTQGCVCNCARAKEHCHQRIWLCSVAMELVICCTGTADVPFIARGRATTLLELFRLTNTLNGCLKRGLNPAKDVLTSMHQCNFFNIERYRWQLRERVKERQFKFV